MQTNFFPHHLWLWPMTVLALSLVVSLFIAPGPRAGSELTIAPCVGSGVLPSAPDTSLPTAWSRFDVPAQPEEEQPPTF